MKNYIRSHFLFSLILGILAASNPGLSAPSAPVTGGGGGSLTVGSIIGACLPLLQIKADSDKCSTKIEIYNTLKSQYISLHYQVMTLATKMCCSDIKDTTGKICDAVTDGVKSYCSADDHRQMCKTLGSMMPTDFMAYLGACVPIVGGTTVKEILCQQESELDAAIAEIKTAIKALQEALRLMEARCSAEGGTIK